MWRGLEVPGPTFKLSLRSWCPFKTKQPFWSIQNYFFFSWTTTSSRWLDRSFTSSTSGTFQKEGKLNQGVPNYLNCFAMAIGEQHLSFMTHKDNSCSSAMKSLTPSSCCCIEYKEGVLAGKKSPVQLPAKCQFSFEVSHLTNDEADLAVHMRYSKETAWSDTEVENRAN